MLDALRTKIAFVVGVQLLCHSLESSEIHISVDNKTILTVSPLAVRDILKTHRIQEPGRGTLGKSAPNSDAGHQSSNGELECRNQYCVHETRRAASRANHILASGRS